jgi:3'-5' exoribonuclease
MAAQSISIVSLSDMIVGQEADVFALLSAKEELLTKNGKPYFKVTFRDSRREVSFPIWEDSPLAAECRDKWTPGGFYKLRAVYRETNFGPQLDIRKIRETCPSDAADGFDPGMCRPQSRFNPQQMFDELLAMVRDQIGKSPLGNLVEQVLQTYHEELLTCPAARRNHHACVGGLLEHTLSVTRTCVFLADKYSDYYPDMQPPLNKALAVAGGILHDIGKIREMREQPEGTTHTAEGALIGHILQGRDIVREAAIGSPIDADTLLRLEHIIISHQRLPEWGSPKPPMTPEALLVHYADDLDAKYNMMVAILQNDTTPGPVTARKNVLMHAVYRGISDA